MPLPGGTAVALLGFPTLDAAIRAGLDLRAHEPVACDLLDRRLLSVTRGKGESQIPPAVGAALLVTFEADTEREATERAWGVVEALRSRHLMRILADPVGSPEGVARVRAVRAAAVAGLQNLARGPRPLAFIEDVGVPPDALPEYLAGVQDILKRIGSLGVVPYSRPHRAGPHPAPGRARQSRRSREAVAARRGGSRDWRLSLGGTVSTQHGVGLARTPWVERQVGPLYPVFRELKRIFDPKNLLNPGKIVGPDPSREAWPLRSGDGRQRTGDGSQGTEDNEIAALSSSPVSDLLSPARAPLLVWKDTTPAAEVARCSGCGDCRTRIAPERMCPVFRATGNEAATPRARRTCSAS